MKLLEFRIFSLKLILFLTVRYFQPYNIGLCLAEGIPMVGRNAILSTPEPLNLFLQLYGILLQLKFTLNLKSERF